MNGSRKTILVVDDVPDDIAILDEILKKEYQVKAVTNGESALKIARSQNPPDLILLDIIMPEMDGFEVCRRLKQDANGAMIPVIFLTAKVMTSDEKLGFDLGAVDYIRKPIEPEIVLSRIRSHLEQKDQLLRSSEVRFRRLFETAKDGIMIVDNGTELIIDVNPSMATILGADHEYFLGKRISDLSFVKNATGEHLPFADLCQQEYTRRDDLSMKNIAGENIRVEFVCNSYTVNNREVTQLNVRDITDLVVAERERKKAEEEVLLKSAALEAAANTVVIADRSGTIKWVNRASELLTGYSKKELIGARPWGEARADVPEDNLSREIWASLISGNVWNGEIEARRKSGELYTEEITITPVRDGSGEIKNFIAIINDITERKKARDRLESLLREKGELLRELHHRVNNNVQVMMSLLSMSSEQIHEPDLRGKFADITRRMQSMAIIHQQFYESENMARIDFALFLAQLYESLKTEFPEASRHATLHCRTGEVFLGLEQAIPAGLIVGELLSNALKFAFPGGREDGAIETNQRIDGDTLEIGVRDNGIGLPENFDPHRAGTLGLMLIRVLSEQLEGKVEFQNDGGTYAVLRFPLKPDSFSNSREF